MQNKPLEQVLDKKIVPIVENSLHKFIGVSIDELNNDITEKIQSNPLLDFDIDINIPFKESKKKFKKKYIQLLLKLNYGNVSEAARIANVDRRSVHRIAKETKINITNIRKEMIKAYEIKQDVLGNIIEKVFDNYKEIIHPKKLNELYENVGEVSKDILDNLPPKPLSLKEAEKEYEKEYLRIALLENGNNFSKTAKKIGLRYETLYRKAKKLGLI